MAFRDSINDLMFRFYERFKQNNNRLPVSVDADINVGDVQIGTVKQGGVDEGAEPWKVKAEELEQKIDVLKQSIESGLQLKGRNVADGTEVLAPSYEVDLEGYPAMRIVDAAPWAYDRETNRIRTFAEVTGRYTETVTIYEGLEIRHTNEIWVAPPVNLSRFKRGALEAINTHDRPVVLTIGDQGGSGNRWYNGTEWAATQVVIPSGPGKRTFFLNTHPMVQAVFGNLITDPIRFGLKCSEAPTSGQFTLRYTGVLL